MEGEVCGHYKFGYCKYKKECAKIHYIQECKDLSTCNSVQSCPLRHPKQCKQFAAGRCRFGFDCDYNHKIPVHSKEECKPKEKMVKLETKVEEMALKILTLETELKEIKQNKNIKLKDNETEKVMKAMVRKVLSLESDMEEIKKNNMPSKRIQDQDQSETEIEKEESKKNFIIDETYFSDKDIKDNSSTPIEKKDNVSKRPSEGTEEEEPYQKEVDEERSKLNEFKDVEEKTVVKTKDVLSTTNNTHTKTNSNKELKCDMCEYVCKKPMTLNKHMNTKHRKQKCKGCEKEFITAMELINHVAKEHYEDKELIEYENEQDYGQNGEFMLDTVV